MAHTFEFNAVSANGLGRAVASKFSAMVETVRTSIAQHRTYRRTLAELENLGRRELNDLGLNKHGLHKIAYEAAYGTAK